MLPIIQSPILFSSFKIFSPFCAQLTCTNHFPAFSLQRCDNFRHSAPAAVLQVCQLLCYRSPLLCDEPASPYCRLKPCQHQAKLLRLNSCRCQSCLFACGASTLEAPFMPCTSVAGRWPSLCKVSVANQPVTSSNSSAPVLHCMSILILWQEREAAIGAALHKQGCRRCMWERMWPVATARWQPHGQATGARAWIQVAATFTCMAICVALVTNASVQRRYQAFMPLLFVHADA